MTLTTETIVKTLAAVSLPILAWLLTLTSDLSRDQQRLAEAERRINLLEEANAQITQELHYANQSLTETAATVRFIREELLP